MVATPAAPALKRTASKSVASQAHVIEQWKLLRYEYGFGNSVSTEALPEALPIGRNSPQQCPYGLYAEQLSGTAFTAPRTRNLRTWLYRIRPSVTHEPFQPTFTPTSILGDFSSVAEQRGDVLATPNQLRWGALPLPPALDEQHGTGNGSGGGIEGGAPADFVHGMHTFCGAGSAATKSGYAVHMYTANQCMLDSCLANTDGDMLIVPQHGALHITCEMGRMRVEVGEIVVMPRGIRFSVDLPDLVARGYVLEIFKGHFVLPDRGPIGANGLADERDFASPVAWFEDRNDCNFRVLHKFRGKLFEAMQPFSPFNVVAWHGNYKPYKYNLSRFCPMNAVEFDHPDPSIFTVLTAPSDEPGTAIADFVVFPPRWSCARNTFRPPYFHRNCMNEFMGLIRGEYEAKEGEKFVPGGASLHMCMTPHGPDTKSYDTNIRTDTSTPAHLPEDTMAFMFETEHTPLVATAMYNSEQRDVDYYQCWMGLPHYFTGEKEVKL